MSESKAAENKKASESKAAENKKVFQLEPAVARQGYSAMFGDIVIDINGFEPKADPYTNKQSRTGEVRYYKAVGKVFKDEENIIYRGQFKAGLPDLTDEMIYNLAVAKVIKSDKNLLAFINNYHKKLISKNG